MLLCISVSAYLNFHPSCLRISPQAGAGKVPTQLPRLEGCKSRGRVLTSLTVGWRENVVRPGNFSEGGGLRDADSSRSRLRRFDS